MRGPDTRPARLLGWRSGGWLVALAVLLMVVVAGWRIAGMLRSERGAVGDGLNVESYGFDLADPLVPAARIVASGLPRDGIPTLDRPSFMAAGDVAPFNEAHRGKYLVSGDRVIGVEIAGDVRAYPLRVLNWHEVVNDVVGGVPIAVTYHPLCDSVAVFDRRVEGETLEFGVSGLLYNSNLLLYDRRSDASASSLWSQLQARAVAGPGAGRRLHVLPASLARWGPWLERHPGSTVLRPEKAKLKRYQRNPYGSYRTRGTLRFPVHPMPPEGSPPTMTPVLALDGRIYSLDPEFADFGDASVRLRELGIDVDTSLPAASVIVPAGLEREVFFSRWFAWYSHHPPAGQSEGISAIRYATSNTKQDAPK